MGTVPASPGLAAPLIIHLERPASLVLLAPVRGGGMGTGAGAQGMLSQVWQHRSC